MESGNQRSADCELNDCGGPPEDNHFAVSPVAKQSEPNADGISRPYIHPPFKNSVAPQSYEVAIDA
jgi:hypothetical protein